MDNFRFPDHDILHLIIAYLEGNASDEETLHLQQWLTCSDENLSLFIQFRKDWVQVGQAERYDVNRAWNKLGQQLAPRVYAYRRRLMIRWIGRAAAIVLLFSIGYYWMNLPHVAPAEEPVSQGILPGSQKALLVLGSNEKVELNNDSGDSILSDRTAVKKEGNTLIYEGGKQIPETGEYNRLITPRGGEYAVVLSDGTKVWLNAESELKYPVVFLKSERKVYLKGEAYFSVKKQNGQPFIVCSDQASITVLGTEFNVRNYEHEAIATTLVKGSVAISNAGGREYQLLPDQQAVIEHDEVNIRKVEVIHYIAWKDGYFVYQDKSLDYILRELSRWYDFTYFYQNASLTDLVLTAKLRKFDSVDQIFDILSETGRFKFVIKGKSVTVMAK